MGVRGEVFSTKVALQNRTYFFNVKENRLGDLYLNIVESKNRDEGGFERQSVILFADDLQEFLKGFDESLRVLEKSVREKRRGAKSEKPAPRFRQGDRESEEFNSSPPRRKREDRADERGRSESPRRYREDGERGRQRVDRSPRGYGAKPKTDSPRAYGERTRAENPRGSRFSERRSERSGRPQQDRKDSSPRQKRVVVKKK